MTTTTGRIIAADAPRTVRPAAMYRLGSTQRAMLVHAVRDGSIRLRHASDHWIARHLISDGLLERQGPDLDGVAIYAPTLAGIRATQSSVLAQDLREGDMLAQGERITQVTDYGTYVALNLRGPNGATVRYLDYGWPIWPTTITDNGNNLPF